MAIVGLIPARGGSKGIPGKNIAMCSGKPLLAYTAEAALAARELSRVILSSDDVSIAKVGAELGLGVPFMRPSELAGDTSDSLGVIAHALEWLENDGVQVEAIVLLQPTSPLRTARHIDEAVALFRSTKPDALVSVTEVPHRFHPQSLMSIEDGILHPTVPADEMVLQRQEFKSLYARNGPAILILSPRQIKIGSLYGGRTVPYLMSFMDSLDIDNFEDLQMAEILLAARKLK